MHPTHLIMLLYFLFQDELNSTVLGDEVLAVEMGTTISNLTDKMSIHFRNVTYVSTKKCLVEDILEFVNHPFSHDVFLTGRISLLSILEW